jgi:hypothetical protein
MDVDMERISEKRIAETGAAGARRESPGCSPGLRKTLAHARRKSKTPFFPG